MAPQIHLGPDGAERLWQRHYENTHTHTRSALKTSSALCIKVITANEKSRGVCVDAEMMMMMMMSQLPGCHCVPGLYSQVVVFCAHPEVWMNFKLQFFGDVF